MLLLVFRERIPVMPSSLSRGSRDSDDQLVIAVIFHIFYLVICDIAFDLPWSSSWG